MNGIQAIALGARIAAAIRSARRRRKALSAGARAQPPMPISREWLFSRGVVGPYVQPAGLRNRRDERSEQHDEKSEE